MARALALAAVLLAAPLAAHAAPPAPPRIAKELSALVVPQETWNQMMSATAEQTRQYIEASIRQSGGVPPPELAQRFADEFGKLYSYAEIVELQASLLAKHYTEPELRQLLAFYKSPVGRKAIRIMPAVMQDVNGWMMTRLQERMPAMMERLRPVMERGKAPAAADAPQR